jgi:tetratricopeptide (TPR) repeat protein
MKKSVSPSHGENIPSEVMWLRISLKLVTLYPDAPTLHTGVPHRDAESVFEDTGERGADPDQAMAVEAARAFNDTHEAASKDRWPLSSASVEVICSPKLSRLFAALKIECSEEEIPTFWLDQTSKSATGQVESPCISKDEFEQLSYRPQSGGDPQDIRQELRSSTVSRSIIRNSSISRNKANPLKYPHLDFLLSHRDDEILLSPSPLHELYVFPAQYSQRYDSSPAAKSLTASELNDLLPWDEKNHRDPLCHEQDPDIIYAMEEHAHSCFDQKDFSEAEYWFRRVLSARKGTEGGNTARILSTALEIIHVVQCSGNIMAARKWHRDIHRTILSYFPPTDGLVLQSLRVREINFSMAAEANEEESLSREILQATLLSFGPKHKKTLGQLDSFASALLDQGKYAEAEKLLLITLQLFRNVPKVEFYIVDAMMDRLVLALLLNGQAEQALEWSIYSAERANAHLGEDNPTAMNTRRQLAECLMAVGRIEESENIFHATMRSTIRVLGERNQETLQCMFSYGRTLSSVGRDSEAETWLRKSHEGLLRCFGPEPRSTLYSCDWLVWCLEKQGRLDEAMQVCEGYRQELCAREGITDQHKHVIKVRDWMDRISESMEMQQRVLDTFTAEKQ